MSVKDKEILSPFENIVNYSADFGAKVVPIKDVFKNLKKSEVKIFKNGKTEVFKVLKYILNSDIKVMKAQADTVKITFSVSNDHASMKATVKEQLLENGIYLLV